MDRTALDLAYPDDASVARVHPFAIESAEECSYLQWRADDAAITMDGRAASATSSHAQAVARLSAARLRTLRAALERRAGQLQRERRGSRETLLPNAFVDVVRETISLELFKAIWDEVYARHPDLREG